MDSYVIGIEQNYDVHDKIFRFSDKNIYIMLQIFIVKMQNTFT